MILPFCRYARVARKNRLGAVYHIPPPAGNRQQLTELTPQKSAETALGGLFHEENSPAYIHKAVSSKQFMAGLRIGCGAGRSPPGFTRILRRGGGRLYIRAL